MGLGHEGEGTVGLLRCKFSSRFKVHRRSTGHEISSFNPARHSLPQNPNSSHYEPSARLGLNREQFAGSNSGINSQWGKSHFYYQRLPNLRWHISDPVLPQNQGQQFNNDGGPLPTESLSFGGGAGLFHGTMAEFRRPSSIPARPATTPGPPESWPSRRGTGPLRPGPWPTRPGSPPWRTAIVWTNQDYQD